LKKINRTKNWKTFAVKPCQTPKKHSTVGDNGVCVKQ